MRSVPGLFYPATLESKILRFPKESSNFHYSLTCIVVLLLSLFTKNLGLLINFIFNLITAVGYKYWLKESTNLPGLIKEFLLQFVFLLENQGIIVLKSTL